VVNSLSKTSLSAEVTQALRQTTGFGTTCASYVCGPARPPTPQIHRQLMYDRNRLSRTSLSAEMSEAASTINVLQQTRGSGQPVPARALELGMLRVEGSQGDGRYGRGSGMTALHEMWSIGCPQPRCLLE
jgi:hypothetical protein